MKKLITDLLYKILMFAKDIVDIPLLINLTLCPYQEFRNAGIKTICEISESADLEGKPRSVDRIDVTFHIHIPFILQCCDKNSKSRNPEVFRNYAL
jgi:hypothetical protein